MKFGSLFNQLKILTFLPLAVFSAIFLFFLFDAVQMIDRLQGLQNNLQTVRSISELITDLQRERGLASGYLESGGKRFRFQLAGVRKEVDVIVRDPRLREKLHTLRNEIDQLEISAARSFLIYTDIIKKLQTRYFRVLHKIDDPVLLKSLYAYINLSFVKEALGQIRGSFNGIFSSKDSVDPKLLYIAMHAKGILDISLEKFYATTSAKNVRMLRQVIDSDTYRSIDMIVKKYSSLNIFHPKEDPKSWFKTTTDTIDKVADVAKIYLSEIYEESRNKCSRLKQQMLLQFLVLLAIFLMIAWLGKKLKDDILRNITLLHQYKEAVDRSSIVSKTDIGGRITYANDKFCEISGYSREELVGKPHNIVRHPEVSKAVFKEMWDDLLSKKPWSGLVKNRKKNGDYYVVEATINPILNHKGEIEEFIAIRNDITEVIKLHEDLERTQEEMILRIGEIGEVRSQETGQHVKRVAMYSELLARYYGLEETEIKVLAFASPMHDIGKVAIPDEILKKTDKLSEEEWEIIKTHTEVGYRLFKDSDKPLLQAAAIIAHEHHEKYDGSGYPRGLKGEEIHIFGRITALADVFDALGSERYYKSAWSDEEIFALLRAERGKHFDPVLIDIFFEHLDEFLEIREQFRDKNNSSET